MEGLLSLVACVPIEEGSSGPDSSAKRQPDVRRVWRFDTSVTCSFLGGSSVEESQNTEAAAVSLAVLVASLLPLFVALLLLYKRDALKTRYCLSRRVLH